MYKSRSLGLPSFWATTEECTSVEMLGDVAVRRGRNAKPRSLGGGGRFGGNGSPDFGNVTQGSFNYLFGGDQAMQIYGSFAGIPL